MKFFVIDVEKKFGKCRLSCLISFIDILNTKILLRTRKKKKKDIKKEGVEEAKFGFGIFLTKKKEYDFFFL